MLLKLRPLVVVTGTIHVEGGATSKRRAPARGGRRKARAVITEELEVTDDRGRANVIAVNFSRRLRKLTLLRTPFGLLIDPARLPALQELSQRLSREAVAFNKTSTSAEITNCLLVEPLAGPRRAAVEGWIARRLAKGDKPTHAARAAFEIAAPVPAPAPPAAETSAAADGSEG